jgi:hypothetical protein
MSANSLRQGLRGVHNVEFKDGQHLRFCPPDWKLGGTIMGDRTMELIGSMIVEDLTNDVKACIIYSTYKKSGFFRSTESGCRDAYTGIIYKCSPIKKERSVKSYFSRDSEDITEFKELKDKKEEICKIEGSFLKKCIIGGEEFWNVDNILPKRHLPVMDYVLPSDFRYREDLIWLLRDYQKIAQKWKLRMEV